MKTGYLSNCLNDITPVIDQRDDCLMSETQTVKACMIIHILSPTHDPVHIFSSSIRINFSVENINFHLIKSNQRNQESCVLVPE